MTRVYHPVRDQTAGKKERGGGGKEEKEFQGQSPQHQRECSGSISEWNMRFALCEAKIEGETRDEA